MAVRKPKDPKAIFLRAYDALEEESVSLQRENGVRIDGQEYLAYMLHNGFNKVLPILGKERKNHFVNPETKRGVMAYSNAMNHFLDCAVNFGACEDLLESCKVNGIDPMERLPKFLLDQVNKPSVNDAINNVISDQGLPNNNNEGNNNDKKEEKKEIGKEISQRLARVYEATQSLANYVADPFASTETKESRVEKYIEKLEVFLRETGLTPNYLGDIRPAVQRLLDEIIDQEIAPEKHKKMQELVDACTPEKDQSQEMDGGMSW